MDTPKLEPLPYATNALEPYVGRETVELHYEKHHAGYVTKLKELIAGKAEANESLERIVVRTGGAIFENAAQIWNHDFYWRSMRPGGGGVPSGELLEAVAGRYRTFDRLRAEFIDAGADHFGSGWLWLVWRRRTLRIMTTSDADLPLRYGITPLLCADLWEHAYYLDYRNDRRSYLEAFVDHLADWEFAAANWNASRDQR
jgi:Fe-Mn family superoxide dismutase